MNKKTSQEIVVTTRNAVSLTMGIVSIIVGVLALLVGWVPFLGLLALPGALIGLLFGLIGMIVAVFKKLKGIGMPFLGCIICASALFIPIASTGGASAAMSDAIDETLQESNSIETGSQKDNKDVEKHSYIEMHLELYSVDAKYMDTILDERVPGVVFKIRNKGPRQLDMVEVTVYFKDSNDSVIAEEIYKPVLVSEYSFGDNKPLKPGYIWQMESRKFYSAKSVPEEWKEGNFEARITDIRFSKD